MSTIRPLSIQVLLAVIAVLLVAAAPSAAAQHTVPPGHSGASQYTETLPTAGGETPTSSVHAGAAAGGPGDSGGGAGGNGAGGGKESGGTTGTTSAVTPAQALGAQNAKRLEKLGPEGKAAAHLAASAGAPAGHSAASHGGSDGSSPVNQVVGELTGTSSSEGMGILLPLLIAMTALVAVAFILTRRRPASPRD